MAKFMTEVEKVKAALDPAVAWREPTEIEPGIWRMKEAGGRYFYNTKPSGGGYYDINELKRLKDIK